MVERTGSSEATSDFAHPTGKALDKAIRSVFGAKSLIQRCRRHKERNVAEHLPEAERPLLLRRLRAAWALPDADQAAAELEAIARAWPASDPAPPRPCARACRPP